MKRILFLLIPLFIFTIVFVIPTKVAVTSARCESSTGTCSSKLDDLIKGEVGKSIKTAWEEVDKSLRESSRVEKYTIRFYLPGELVVYAIEKMPIIAVQIAGQPGYILINTNGDKIDTSDDTSLPKVIITGQGVLDSEVFFSAEILKNLHSLHGVNQAEVSKDQFKVNLLPDVEFLYPTEGDVDVLLGSTELLLFQLNSLLEKSKIEDSGQSRETVVDLRYENPVIRYKGNE